ncbi:MAG: hypothetical protein KDI36_05925 [Pseudomonadales bacterium]|nr:hypothetical protein [Pseudomonadales bacterium]
MSTIRIGLMGFGRIGRQIYRLAHEDPDIEVVAVSDVGRPEILHHLLTRTMRQAEVRLEGNYLISNRGRTRMLSGNLPAEVPWDVFDVDVVIDATSKFKSIAALQPHIDNGARRVITSVLPEEGIDRVILFGVNNQDADASDRIISAGSASTTATALALKTITSRWNIEHASMTSVHAYTSDQSLQDLAGPDYRRSRSGAENIIPNHTPALQWVQHVMPELDGKMTAYALNVPVQTGSLVDLTLVFSDPDISVEAVNACFADAEKAMPELIATTTDPIVSSDVTGFRTSMLVDLDGTIKAGERTIKLLAWHETLGHARRILDVVHLYSQLDSRREAA